MEQGKQGNPPVKKEGDGLTKKERKALKVQEKLKQQNVSSNKNDKCETNKNEKKQGAKKQNKQSPVVPDANSSSQLTEKELRKLEWEKKLAAQKAEAGDKSEKTEGLSKAQLKALRREQQEAQRQAKAVVKQEQKPKPESIEPKKPLEVTNKPPPRKIEKKKSPETKRLQIVNHLYVDARFDNIIVNYKNVHPAFVRLGVQYSTKKILGSNARCLALLSAIKYLINDLQSPPKQEFCRYLLDVLQSGVEYLQNCRPFAVSMSNALRHLKVNIRKATALDDNTKKDTLLGNIGTYINEEINTAGEAISMKVKEKITDGDVILTYGCSSLVKKILLDAHKQGKQFQVIVVDGRPFLEGRQMIQRLAQNGINCSYVQINAISYVMSLASKVLLGAHALLTNGYVMSRIGTAQVALVAQAYNKPVLVCCETYKFSERVQTDSFVYNELGEGSMLTSTDTLEEKSPLLPIRTDSNLQILNLLYDVTPPDLITAVVTELAILPCTSAPAVLRMKPTEFV